MSVKFNCVDTIIIGLKKELCSIVDSSRFKVVDMDFGIDIYDNRIAIYKHLYNILSSNKIEDIPYEVRKFGMSNNPIGQQACLDSDITLAIDMIGYSRFLSCSCMDDINVSIGSIYANGAEKLACDLYSDYLGTHYCITLFAHGSSWEYIESIIRGFAKLFTALVKQFGLSKSLTKFNRYGESNTEFIENCFINYIFSLDNSFKEVENSKYALTYSTIKDIIAQM